MKRIIYAAAALAALTSCAGDEVKSLLRKEYKTEPVSVNVMQVKTEEGIASIRLVGRAEAGKSANVSSQWPGTLQEICVRKGQKVSKGDVLARLDAQSVRSSYDIAKASFDQAADALERVEKVYGNGSVSEVKLKEINTQYAKAKATLESAEKAVEDCNVKAPFSGVIGEIFVEQGVQLAALAPMFELLDNSSVEIHASIPENEYSLYPVGTEASVEIPAVGRSVDATLAVKGIQASALSHSYDLCFKLDGPCDGLMPGMTCKVSLSSSADGKKVIPASSVKTDSEGRYVWVIADGTVEKRHVITGGFSGKGIVISEGLDEGELVVTDGARKISSGMKGIKVNML